MSGPLASVRIVDLTDIRGALCGRILADLGAEVLKVESLGADPSAQTTTAYRYRHANKYGAVIDLDDPGRGGRDRLASLLARADVLVENLHPDRRRHLELVPAELVAQHPSLIHVALTDFGLDGPRAGWSLRPLTGLAAGGTLYASGFADMPPCAMPGHLAHDCASIYAAVGVAAALMDRARTGRGQVVEVSAQEATLAGTIPWSVVLEDYLKVSPFLPAHGTRNADGSYWVLQAADGWVRTVIGNTKQWQGFLRLLREPEVLAGPEWTQPSFRIINSDVIRMVANDCLQDRTRTQLFDEARKLGATIGVIQTASEYVEHEQTRARRVFAATAFPGLDEAPFVSPPLQFGRTPSSIRRPAPAPGEEAPPGWAARPPRRPSVATSPGGELLLDGMRVVEFGMAAVVPEVSLILSELGADVVKVESEAHPDVLRASGFGRINCGFAFNDECRGRRSVALNLDTERGRQLAFDLCRTADLVLENNRGGVLDGMGLGYEAVKEVNPAVIYVSSQGYGREGPLAEMPAYGPLNLGFVGQHLLWNHPDAPYPCGTALNHPDHIASKLLAVGTLAAVHHRRETGEGQLVQMAQTDAAAFLLGEIYVEAHLSGIDPQPRGNSDDSAVPHGVYPSAGDDRWIAVAVTSDAEWIRLCGVLGWQLDPSYATLDGRLAAREQIDSRLTRWTAARPAEEAAALLQAAGVSAMPVMGPQDHLSDPHLAGRGFIVTLNHPEVGSERHCGNPVRYSVLAQRVAQSAPCLGAHTEEVLTSMLGLRADEVAALVESGVCK